MVPSLVEELSISPATAMTSPLAATAETGAVIAPAGFDNDQIGVDLTAAVNTQPANDTSTFDTSPEKTYLKNAEGRQIKEETGREDMVAHEDRFGNMEAVSLQQPQENNGFNLKISQMPPLDLGGITESEAIAAFMRWDPPQRVGEFGAAIGGPVLPVASVDGFQFSYSGPPPHLREQDETRISAYAMLEFDDGQFYMNTYSVILGRDLAAARAAMRRDALRQRREAEGITGESDTPTHIRGERSRYTRSLISESAGILREGDDSDSDERARRRRHRRHSKKSKSTGSSSQRISRRNSLALQNGKVDYQSQPQARRYAPDNVMAAPVDPASLRPSPYDCPLVGIHPPAATPASGFKAISRQHVKIAYNSKKNLFEAEIIGRNGAFIDEVFYYHSDIVPLKSGSVLQIGGVVVRFILPEVAIGETGAEGRSDYEDGIVVGRYSEGGKEMSFDFEDTPREGAKLETSDEESADEDEEREEEDEEDDEDLDEDREDIENSEGDNENKGNAGDESEEDDEDEEDEQGEEEVEKVQEPPPMPQKRRGPGRPPKNGVMSKREQLLAKREAQQKAKKTVPQPQAPVKNKVGRPRKYPRPETPPIKLEKRKYTKRKPKDPDAIAKQDGSGDDGATKEKKEKKAAKPPRSPTPTFREVDLTPEQLAKPNANYVTLIHEALSNSPNGMMSLPQIYRAIQRKYPYFVVRCPTTGWQSSVRHNLSQHHAFRKVERDGKGWMWAIVDGVSIEKEKKRRPTPPHQMPPVHIHHQPIYTAGPPPHHMMQGPPGMMGPPPGYQVNGNIFPHFRPGQPQHYGPRSTNGHFPPGAHFPINGQNQPFPGQIPPAAQPVGPHGATYSSPYAPKPSADAAIAPNPGVSSDHRPQMCGPSPQAVQQQSRPGLQQPPQLNESIARAIETFRTALVTQLSGKSGNAEAVVASAISQVLGITTQSLVPGDPQEEKIMIALRGMLMKIPGASFPNLPNLPNQSRQIMPQQSQPQQPLVAGPSQQTPSILAPRTLTPPNTAKPPLAVIPSISRPSFAGQGQNRTGGAPSSVPRPQMMTPKIARTNSGSPSNATARPGSTGSPASPALAPTVANGVNVQKSVVNDNGKRQLEDPEDMSGRDLKRLGATGLPPLKA